MTAISSRMAAIVIGKSAWNCVTVHETSFFLVPVGTNAFSAVLPLKSRPEEFALYLIVKQMPDPKTH
ncbi:MAG: hypothetical protein AB8C46_13685 [Burkholderiaceae bacterium]